MYIILVLFPHRQHHKRGFIKWTNLLFYMTNGIALLLNCIDIIYYRFTNRRTSMMVFDEFSGETNYLQLTYHILLDYYYIGIIFIALIIGMVAFLRKEFFAKPYLSGWKYFSINLILMSVFMGMSVIAVRGGLPPKQDFPLNPSDAGQYVQHPNDIAIVLNTPFTMLLSIDKPYYPVKQYYKTNQELEKEYSPVHKPDKLPVKRPLNIVVIMVESLGREVIGYYNQKLEDGKYKGYTPFLDSLCRHAYVFMNSYANSRISIEGTPAIAASIPSLEESFTVSLYSGNKINSLASCLKRVGYRTYYFHGAPNGSLGLNSFAKVAGFDYYIGTTEYNNDEDFDGTWGIWDHKFLPYMAIYLNKVQTPFLSYIFTASSHHPYKIPSELKDKFPDGTLQIHKSLSYTDYSLRLFFESARKQKWYRNTLFIITGDHTCTPYYPEFKTTTGVFAVPIIFYKPESDLVAIDSSVAQQIDIMPTILNYIGYDRPYMAFGQDLFKAGQYRFAVNYIGDAFQYIDDEWVLQFDLYKTVAMFHYKTDPLLEKNLVGKNLKVQELLERKIKAFIQQYNCRMVHNQLTIETNQ